MDLQAPLTVFLDESGSVDFRQPLPGARKKAHAVCAVAVPTIAFAGLRSIVPRNVIGGFLKSSHENFNNDLAVCFVDQLVRSEAEVGAFLVDPGAAESIQVANARAELANARRAAARESEETDAGKREHPPIKPQDLHYLVFLGYALFACLEVCARRRRAMPSFIDVVVDTKDVDEFQRHRFVSELRRICREHGLVIGEFAWKTEEQEPLLLLPDLFGGILCREDRFRDVGAAAHKLWDAERAGRFKFLNKPPSERVVKAETAEE